jgi:DNA-binding IclR family transcriptional regulator
VTTSNKDKQVSEFVTRTLNMLELLSGALPDGLRNKDIAAALGCEPSYVTRCFDILEAKGWAEKTPSGQMRVTSRFSQLSFRVLAGFERASTQLQDMQRNYTRGG